MRRRARRGDVRGRRLRSRLAEAKFTDDLQVLDLSQGQQDELTKHSFVFDEHGAEVSLIFFGHGGKQRCMQSIRNTTDAKRYNVSYDERLTIPMFELKLKHTLLRRADLRPRRIRLGRVS